MKKEILLLVYKTEQEQLIRIRQLFSLLWREEISFAALQLKPPAEKVEYS